LPPQAEEERHPHLRESIAVMEWVYSNIHGVRIPILPTSKRAQLAGACWHGAIEPAQAIVVLVAEGLYGSALAMQRPLFESVLARHVAASRRLRRGSGCGGPRQVSKRREQAPRRREAGGCG
jgi:hypothetical protein